MTKTVKELWAVVEEASDAHSRAWVSERMAGEVLAAAFRAFDDAVEKEKP